MGGTRFEQRHAAALAQLGHTVGVIKHAGTRLDVPDAPFMVNNAARLMQARQKGEKHLGGGPSTLKAWLNEPRIILNALRDAFPRIDVIGNSFGAIAALWSLIQQDAPLEKIKTLLLMAGAQGLPDDPAGVLIRVWNLALLSAPVIWDKITLDPPLSIIATMKEAYGEIAAKAGALPQSIHLEYLVAAQDELLKLSDTEKFDDKIMGGRGDITIADDRAYPAHGLLAHDTPDYPTEELLKLLN
jgi:hypothetical protein